MTQQATHREAVTLLVKAQVPCTYLTTAQPPQDHSNQRHGQVIRSAGQSFGCVQGRQAGHMLHTQNHDAPPAKLLLLLAIQLSFHGQGVE